MTAVSTPVAAARRSTVGLVVLLGSMAALGAVTIDLYLPSLPDVAADLGTTPAQAQLTITGVLVGAGFGQLLVGPLSDAFGRRGPAIAGFGLYVVACLLCSTAQSLETLALFRVLAGVGSSAGSVIGMAVIRDLFVGPVAARLMSRLVLVIGVAPLFAPTVGGALAGVWGWRIVLALLVVAGLGVLVAVWRRLPETRPEVAAPADGSVATRGRRVRGAFAGYLPLLRDARFLGLAVMPGLSLATIMSYVSVSPFVLQEGFALTSSQFAMLFALNGVALVGGSQLNAALMERFGSQALLRTGVLLSLVFSGALLWVVLSDVRSLVALVVPLWLLLGSAGLVMPNAVTLALEPYGASAGSAAALVTAVQSGLGGLVGALTGLLGGDDTAMVTVMVGATVGNAVLLAVAAQRSGRRRAARTS
ncbi:Bcr/CflA family efflux MFS transporter [Kineococcus sp. R8]|uniref:multidrug effflux MFS transporter n=1 Tax=Kineococcus siccus TaxID=2696567 RepID=UPI0014135ABB|nr:multidrug effflux MFS transporter [Kineococcus siccus]NAZ81437.1 Bcr/CflA family efflux MFS transporter [Kineococcus siccus]